MSTTNELENMGWLDLFCNYWQLTPSQIRARVEEANRRDSNDSTQKLFTARYNLLPLEDREKGWIYFKTIHSLEQNTTIEQYLNEKIFPGFPPGIQFLVCQIGFDGGIIGTPGQGSWSMSRYHKRPDGYTIFIKTSLSLITDGERHGQ